MDKVTTITSRTVVINQSDIDTDQIVPARFLTTTTRVGLGKALFADWRYDKQSGAPLADFMLNRPEAAGCQILVAGNNFGCGSSREHAPWALLDYGIRAVISTGIADIFRGNSLKNGLVPVIVDAATHAWLTTNPGAELTVDVESQTLRLPGGRSVEFPIDGFSRFCLLNGVDQLGFLLKQDEAITRFEKTRAWQP
jgi:3-isopropylmalate/(R)-2-methylmalate dehydratase small subunit